MATQIERIVDAHIHLWDPARTDWYPYLSGGQELDMGDISGMCRRFDLDTYFSESAKWNVEKLVHVSAAGRFIADETREREEMAQAAGHPDAIVGGIVPEQSVAETVALLDDQMASPHFRGVRCMGFVPGGVPDPTSSRALQERNLVFDLMVHTDELQPAASALADWGDLTVVVEHAGWPRTNTSDELALWKTGMSALAVARRKRPLQAVGPGHAARVDGRGGVRALGRILPSRCSASTAASSRATSRSTPCTGPSTSSTRRSTR